MALWRRGRPMNSGLSSLRAPRAIVNVPIGATPMPWLSVLSTAPAQGQTGAQHGGSMATVPTVRSVWVALLITIAAGFLVVAAEVDRLVAASSSPSYSLLSLFNPFHLEVTDARILGTWRGAAGAVSGLPGWVATEVAALCIVGLALLVLLVFAAFSF